MKVVDSGCSSMQHQSSAQFPADSEWLGIKAALHAIVWQGPKICFNFHLDFEQKQVVSQN